MTTPSLTRHRFTVEEYYHLAALGILHEDSKVEFIRGTIYNKFPPEGGDVRPYRFTHDAVARMVAAGLLIDQNDSGDDVDTTDGGEDVAAMGIHHQVCIIRLTPLLIRAVPAGFLVSPQNPHPARC